MALLDRLTFSGAASAAPEDGQPASPGLAALSMAALGVVYGDIGTSPLYAIKEIFASPEHPLPLDAQNVLGVLSLVFWSLMLVVSIKYVSLILRADNRGEGGIIALMSLVLGNGIKAGTAAAMTLVGLLGAALFYGDSAITPAISVLSAVEGLEVATPFFQPYVIPIALAILVGLFLFQRRGTAAVGLLFGPIMGLWFITLALLGVAQIAREPSVLKAAWPGYAASFAVSHPGLAFFALSGVFLVVTGSEALYADIGHFGRRPIRRAWFALVLPALLVNYFGQGALILREPAALSNPFYLMVGASALYPLVILATIASVIASQAVISGAYSITQQAMQLGYLPRLAVRHTSSSQVGQVYLPAVNWVLLALVGGLVLGFGSSTRLAVAYGLAVTGTMVVTTLFAAVVARHHWKWGTAKTACVFGALLAVDLVFLAANAVKIRSGGWFPLAFGAAVFTVLTTWKRGRELLGRKLDAEALPLADFIAAVGRDPPATVRGTAVFLTRETEHVPHALLHNLRHNRVLHERVVLATVAAVPRPRVEESARVAVKRLTDRFYRVTIYYGFMDRPDVPAALEWCAEQGLSLEPEETSYFIGRETAHPGQSSGMAPWRSRLFAAMARNSAGTADYFMLPPNRVVELGSQVIV